jgi:hypothetical protein
MNIIDILNKELKDKTILVYQYKLGYTSAKESKTVYHYYINKPDVDIYQTKYWNIINISQIKIKVNSVSGYYEPYEGNHMCINFTSPENKEYHMDIEVDKDIEIVE